MKLETIYNELQNIMRDNMSFEKALKLKERLEKAIREEASYKTTSRTRVNAIKRIASNIRPALQGYGLQGGYQIVTDSYHLIWIHNSDMPLKLVTTDVELAKKHGTQNCINSNYPNISSSITYNVDLTNFKEEIINKIKLDDMYSFYKLHHSDDNENLYCINNKYYNINFLKNIIDVLTSKDSDLKLYTSEDPNKPLYIKNNNDEGGLVLPVRKYK